MAKLHTERWNANEQAIVKVLETSGPVTVSSLQLETGLSKPTLLAHLRDLSALGRVVPFPDFQPVAGGTIPVTKYGVPESGSIGPLRWLGSVWVELP